MLGWRDGQVFSEVAGQCGVEVALGIFSFIEAMTAIRIGDLGELFVVIDEFVDEDFAVLVVAIVISGAINEQQISL